MAEGKAGAVSPFWTPSGVRAQRNTVRGFLQTNICIGFGAVMSERCLQPPHCIVPRDPAIKTFRNPIPVVNIPFLC